MSADVLSLQAQVESVLAVLVKTATVELTKLFESRYRGSVCGDGDVDVDVGRDRDQRESEMLEIVEHLSKRSVGVQVDEEIYPLLELSAPPVFSDGDCLKECRGEVEAMVEGCLLPSEILLAEDNGHTDPEWSPLKEQDLTETLDMVELRVLEAEAPAGSDAQTEVVLQVCAETWTETLRHGSTPSSPKKQKPLVIQPDTCARTSGEKVKFVCPLILKPESPSPNADSLKKPVQSEPQQSCVSTAKGTAYSPSLSDGAVTPIQAGVWERIHTPKEKKNNLHMKLKLTSPDKKLLRPCAVELVNMLTVPQDGVVNAGCRLPKDLRRHQGLHTGHRLCCFTPGGDGVWRLQKVVAHSRDGYACSSCEKTFKRRKILRRHERFHTGEKPYACTVCSKTFALRKSLRRHVRFHTGERPHTCTHCKKSFRLRENLKAHLRFHTGEKPFICTLCGKTFRIMKNLEKHNLSQCEFYVPSFRTIAGL